MGCVTDSLRSTLATADVDWVNERKEAKLPLERFGSDWTRSMIKTVEQFKAAGIQDAVCTFRRYLSLHCDKSLVEANEIIEAAEVSL